MRRWRAGRPLPPVIFNAYNIESRAKAKILADAGLPSEMGLPQVKQSAVFPTVTILGGTSDRFYFISGEYKLGVNLCISPFSKEPLKQAR